MLIPLKIPFTKFTNGTVSEKGTQLQVLADSLRPVVLDETQSNEDDGDEALIRIFDRDGEQGAEDLLGFDQDGLEDDAEEEQWDLADDGELLTDV